MEGIRKTVVGLRQQFTTQKATFRSFEEGFESFPSTYRTASTAPIRDLSTDVLAMIFIAHSALDWKAPLTIGLVCRGWRQLLLITPRAWAFIPIQTRGIPDHVLRTWLERSGAVPLHIYLKYDISIEALDIVMKVSCNITCISMPPRFYQYLADYDFPNLVQISVSDTKEGGRWWNRSYGVDLSKFPKLISLHLADNANDTFSIKSLRPGFAPLQELRISSNDSGQDWLKVVQYCAKTLVSLSIWMGGSHLTKLTPTTIQLPRLHYLFLSFTGRIEGRFPVTLETPNLQCYEEHNCSLHHPTLHNDTNTVTEFVLDSTIPHQFEQLPKVRILHINLESSGGLQTLRNLGYDRNICPEIERVELYHSGHWSFPAKSAIHSRSLLTGRPIQIVDSDIPFMDLDCGYRYEALKDTVVKYLSLS